jgi:P-type Ca2+ transporter type 2C
MSCDPNHGKKPGASSPIEREAFMTRCSTEIAISNVLLATDFSSESTFMSAINRSLWTITIGTIVALLLVLYVPLLRSLFHFTILHPNDVLIAVLAGFFGVLWFEALKLANGRRRHHQNPAEAGK